MTEAKPYYNFEGQTGYYRGKVRDVYYIKNKYVVMIASDRLSAFDVVLKETIPFKGHVLNQMAAYFLKETAQVVPNWLMSTPFPNVSIGLKCEPFMVEMVVRGYLSGHAWRQYRQGIKTICGVTLPDGLKENDRLPSPVITPTTKAHEGHDEDISGEEIVSRGIVEKEEYHQLEKYALQLFQEGSRLAMEKGLILVDTKYEFGKANGIIYLIDEVHTPDSSRYFYASGYAEKQAAGQPQMQLSKEFVREWLIQNNFQGKPGQTPPDISPEKAKEISDRYISLFQTLTAVEFNRNHTNPTKSELEQEVNSIIAGFS